MSRSILSLLACLLLAVPALSQEVSQDRLTKMAESSVRVSAAGGTGTGGIIDEDDNYYYILTNKHVVGRQTVVAVEFVKWHQLSHKMKGQVIGGKLIPGGSFDVAIVAVSKSNFKYPMTVMPLIEREPTQQENVYALTGGAQAGAQPSIQPVQIIENVNGQMIYYLPTSLPGRSGSLLVNAEAKNCLGVVAWMTDKDGRRVGLAQSTKRISQWVEGTIRNFQGGRANTEVMVPAAIPLDPSAQEIPLAKPVSFVGDPNCTNGFCKPYNPQSPFVKPGEGANRTWPANPGPSLPFGPQQPQTPQPDPTPPADPQVTAEDLDAVRVLVTKYGNIMDRALERIDNEFTTQREVNTSLVEKMEQVDAIGEDLTALIELFEEFSSVDQVADIRDQLADLVGSVQDLAEVERKPIFPGLSELNTTSWAALGLSVLSLIWHYRKRNNLPTILPDSLGNRLPQFGVPQVGDLPPLPVPPVNPPILHNCENCSQPKTASP